MQALAAGCDDLQILKLYRCVQITDTGMFALAKCRNLKHLNISGCNKISNTGLLALGKIQSLQILNTCDCDGITYSDGIASLIEQFRDEDTHVVKLKVYTDNPNDPSQASLDMDGPYYDSNLEHLLDAIFFKSVIQENSE